MLVEGSSHIKLVKIEGPKATFYSRAQMDIYQKLRIFLPNIFEKGQGSVRHKSEIHFYLWRGHLLFGLQLLRSYRPLVLALSQLIGYTVLELPPTLAFESWSYGASFFAFQARENYLSFFLLFFPCPSSTPFSLCSFPKYFSISY